MPVVTISLATAALSQYNIAELVPATIKESTTRDMFYSGLPLGTVPGSEGNMTHAHTHAHSTLLFCLMYSHIFLKGVAREVFCFGAVRHTAQPSSKPTAWWDVGKALAQCLPHHSVSLYWSCSLYQKKLDGAVGGKECVGHTQPDGVFTWQSITATWSDKDTTWEISLLCCLDCWMLYGKEHLKECGFINW